MNIAPEDFSDWKRSIITTAFFKLLRKDCDWFIETWANGDTAHDPLLNARYVGTVEALNKILNLTVEDLNEEPYEETN
jgi:hypothetical protein